MTNARHTKRTQLYKVEITFARRGAPDPNERQCAMDFINGVSAVAEEEGHHPDFHLTNYRDVRVDVTTHAIGGLSLHDFVLAAKLDQIEVTYSPKWLRENGSNIAVE